MFNEEQKVVNVLKEYITDLLSGVDELEIIASNEYDSEKERKSNMVIVGITNKEKVYPMTQDYKYEVQIVVNSFIADDEHGEIFNQIYSTIEENVSMRIFSDPVVGFLKNAISFNESGTSHQATINYNIWISK